MTIYIEIAIAAPLSNTLHYSLPAEIAVDTTNLIGRRALVPLGKQKVTGYILAQTPPPEQKDGEKRFVIKNIFSLLDDHPLFHPEMVPFFRWISSYYLVPLGLVIKAALPGGLVVKSGKQLVLTGDEDELVQCAEGEPWLLEIAQQGQLSPGNTAVLLQKKKIADRVTQLEEKGLLECRNVLLQDRVGSRLERCFRLASSSAVFFRSYRDELDALRDSTKEDVAPLVKFLREKLEQEGEVALSFAETRTLSSLAVLCLNNDGIPAKELFAYYSGARRNAQALLASGLMEEYEKRIFRTPFGSLLLDDASRFIKPEQLSAQQEEALAALRAAILAQRYQAFLLFGITGSGKTEVYLRAAEETLASGRDVIVLVPEIALATQLEGQFVARFGDKVVLQHSGLRPSEKYDQYSLALQGGARIVIGARSAVFAPVKNPGLIIVDEEHDSSYKQDDSFCYNGRDLAIVRASQQQAVVLLGSATPAVTSFAHGINGKFTLLEMDQRVGNAVLPKVSLVDLGKEKQGVGGIFSELLLEKMKKNLSTGYQTILLLNRRGFSTALICVKCGTPVQCPHCTVSLTLHKHNSRLICHYCGFQLRIQVVCSQCRSDKLLPAGFGTEKVEEKIAAIFPEAVVRRLDSDIARNRRRFHTLLAEMHERKIDILIGTQMIAKGHHFPYVTLVGVVWADGGMSMPDYKAAEKSFQLITQVTGRAGRGDVPGEVVIQTLRPEHYAIQYAKNHQYREFFAHELELRQNPVFPPVVRLVLLRMQGRVESYVRDSGLEVAQFCRSWLRANKVTMEVLGPAPSPVDRVKDNFRYQILLKSFQVAPLHHLCRELLHRQREFMQSGVRLFVDVDPENMM